MKRRITSAAIALLAFSSTMSAQFSGKFQKDSLERIYLEVPVLDMGYQVDVAKATDDAWTSITNQSMGTTLDLCEDAQVAAHLGIRKLFGDKKISKLAMWGYDILAMFLPFGSSWGHEEYHRAVMGYRGVKSYDEVWNMQIGASTISVSHETDEALAAMHDNYINDFIRMNTAGLEAQTHLVQSTQRHDFFQHRHLSNWFNHCMNIFNNWGYIDMCADPEANVDVLNMNNEEPEIKDRDFTGYDLSAWAYEMYHPGVKYADRGTHISGNGIDRYITTEKIGDEGLRFLKKQAKRELLNFISPMMIGIDRIPLATTKDGQWYGNFAVRHFLTHFGDNMSIDLMLETPKFKVFAAPHIYTNRDNTFAGFEAGLVDHPLLGGKVLLNATAKVWSQPETFTADKGKLGGLLKADVSYKLGKRWMSYIQLSGKTDGWQQGEVHLDGNFSCRAGFRWLMYDGSK